jgi:hypothetical protein
MTHFNPETPTLEFSAVNSPSAHGCGEEEFATGSTSNEPPCPHSGENTSASELRLLGQCARRSDVGFDGEGVAVWV